MSSKDLIDRLVMRLALPSFLDTKDDLALFKEIVETIEMLNQPDCRLCRHIAVAVPGGLQCVSKEAACVEGNQFKRTTIPPQWQTKKPRKRA